MRFTCCWQERLARVKAAEYQMKLEQQLKEQEEMVGAVVVPLPIPHRPLFDTLCL